MSIQAIDRRLGPSYSAVEVLMIPCPACRSLARAGRCPFCGAAVVLAAAALLATSAVAQENEPMYGVPDTGQLPLQPADPTTRASQGKLTDDEIQALTVKASTDLSAAKMLAENALAKGDNAGISTALLAMSRLDPKDPTPLYRLTMLGATGTDSKTTLKHAGLALEQLALWPSDHRLKREISLRKVVATCHQTLHPDSAEAVSAAKAYVAVAVEGHVRVSEEMRVLSQMKKSGTP